MIKRTIDIAEQAYLHIENRQLLVDKDGETVARIAVEDLGILILQHPGIIITQSVITLCQQHNVAIVFCNERHLPISIALPLWDGHSTHTKVLRQQISVTEPTRKRLWQQVVKQKIAQQALTLESFGVPATGLLRLRDKVKSGDPENCEAQAAQQYWPLLMGKEFRRDPDGDTINQLLNYGYAVVRAMIARGLVGTGLHPAIGLHHRNQYNGLCLADDIMEPFRPWVDWEVRQLMEAGEATEINRQSKQRLLGMLAAEVILDKRKMPLMVAVHSVVAGLKVALTTKNALLRYPCRVPS
jgi:CRISPR-associated protein Cas1